MYAGEVFCGEIKVKDGQKTYEVDCEDAVAASITIVQPYDYLTICEVEAFGIPTEESPLENIAPGKNYLMLCISLSGRIFFIFFISF